jgi:hypothetical protein
MNVRALVRNVTDFARLASMPSLFIPSGDPRSADMRREMDKAAFRNFAAAALRTVRIFSLHDKKAISDQERLGPAAIGRRSCSK